jgi:hypothetical protein
VTAVSDQPNTFPGVYIKDTVTQAGPSNNANGAHMDHERVLKKRKISAPQDEMAAFSGEDVGGIDASLEGLI